LPITTTQKRKQKKTHTPPPPPPPLPPPTKKKKKKKKPSRLLLKISTIYSEVRIEKGGNRRSQSPAKYSSLFVAVKKEKERIGREMIFSIGKEGGGGKREEEKGENTSSIAHLWSDLQERKREREEEREKKGYGEE